MRLWLVTETRTIVSHAIVEANTEAEALHAVAKPESSVHTAMHLRTQETGRESEAEQIFER